MKDYFRWFYEFLIEKGLDPTTSVYLNLLFNIILFVLFILLTDIFIRKVIIKAIELFSNKTRTTFDDFLVKSRFPNYVAHLVPLGLIILLTPFLLLDFPESQVFVIKAIDIYVILLVVWIFRSFIKSTRNYLNNKDAFKDKPLDSFAQIAIIILWFFGIIFIFSELTGQSIVKFLTTLGAASAILLLIFKDSLLGLVASIQVSVNDMVRIGDWITQEKYGADGNVYEINLTTVKVRNFDNTITTIPTYSLISDSFKNWRGMQSSEGRRIKRSLIIKANSVRFLLREDLDRLAKIQMLSNYIEHRQKDIDKYNEINGIDKSVIVNGRNQTNLGIFRKYCDQYVRNHSAINKDLMIMIRHLPPTSQGIPIEIYAFSSDKRWENYEYIMADIFEHLMASVSYFELELHELPTGRDISLYMLEN